jgi:hypothetical protein
MPLPVPWRSVAYVLLLASGAAVTVSCAKDPLVLDRNRPPETYLVAAPVDTTVAALPYSYRLHLYWRGEDSDGFVVGYLWAFDDTSITNFHYTTKTDSIFVLTVNDSAAIASGGGTGSTSIAGTSRAHTFYVRAVDNLGKQDPSLAMFNSRTYVASTQRPSVQFTGSLPSGTVEIDTLCDGAPFQVTWTGQDPDGIPGAALRYRINVGTYQSRISTDSFAYFNDANQPGAVPLASGLYTLTVTAIDIANAIGEAKFQFVVNRDPETWFLPKGAPVGHYIQHFYRGQQGVNIEGTFAEGDTVPYRSTVWWEWDGEDSHGGCEDDVLTGWSFNLSPGTRNQNEPYNIGFLDTLSVGPPLVRFNNNDPARLGPLEFTTLILDSLDAGYNFVARVRSRDGAGRPDGTPATFRFHCNFPPQLTGLTVRDTFTVVEPGGVAEAAKYIAWTTEDYEDGITKYATITLDGTLKRQTGAYEQGILVAERTFRSLSGLNPHSIDVNVRDRADIKSDTTLSISTTVTYP